MFQLWEPRPVPGPRRKHDDLLSPDEAEALHHKFLRRERRRRIRAALLEAVITVVIVGVGAAAYLRLR